jgi:hypothetical protein
VQGNYWGDHNGGESVASVAHARLASSFRRVYTPANAHLFFIPLQTRNMCFAGDARNTVTPFKACGVDFEAHKDLPGMWRWLLHETPFGTSDGSDHFIVVEPPYAHMQGRVRAAVKMQVHRHVACRPCKSLSRSAALLTSTAHVTSAQPGALR